MHPLSSFLNFQTACLGLSLNLKCIFGSPLRHHLPRPVFSNFIHLSRPINGDRSLSVSRRLIRIFHRKSLVPCLWGSTLRDPTVGSSHLCILRFDLSQEKRNARMIRRQDAASGAVPRASIPNAGFLLFRQEAQQNLIVSDFNYRKNNNRNIKFF